MKTAPAWYSKGAGVYTASPISSTKDGHNSTNRSSSDISQPVVKQYSSQIHSRKNAGQMLPLDGKNASSLTSESATHAYSLPLNGLLSLVEWPSFPCAHHEDMKAGIAEIWRDLTTSLARVNTLMKISWPWASYSQFSDLVKLQIKLLRFQYSKCYLNTLKEHSPERKHQAHPRWLVLVNSALVRPRLAVVSCFRAPQYKTDIDILEQTQQKSISMVKRLVYTMYKERLRDGFNWKKVRLEVWVCAGNILFSSAV